MPENLRQAMPLLDKAARQKHPVAELRLVGAFPLGDTDRILASLEESLPLRVRRTLPWWVSVEPR